MSDEIAKVVMLLSGSGISPVQANEAIQGVLLQLKRGSTKSEEALRRLGI